MSERLNWTGVMGGIFYAVGGLAMLNAVLGFIVVLIADGSWGAVLSSLGTASLFIYVGTVHSRLRECEQYHPKAVRW